MPRVLTVGPHGGENLGDELILASILDVISESGGAATAMSSHPADTMTQHAVAATHQVNVKRRSFGSLRSIETYDLLVLAGGEQLAEGRFHNPLWGHLANAFVTLEQARRRGVEYIIYSVGAEEVRTRLGRYMLRRILDAAAFVGIRDEASLAYIRGIVPSADLVLTADPVLLLPRRIHEEARVRFLARHGLSDRPVILFAPADDHRVNTAYVESATEGLLAAAEALGGHLVVQLMEHQPSYDPRLLENDCFRDDRITVLPLERFNRDSLIDTFSGVDCVVSARMHPLIVSATQGTPWLSLDRNSKLRNFAVDAGAPGLPLHALPTEISDRVLELVRQGRARWVNEHEADYQKLRERAERARALLRQRIGSLID